MILFINRSKRMVIYSRYNRKSNDSFISYLGYEWKCVVLLQDFHK